MNSETLQRDRGTNATHNNAVVTERRLTRSEVLAKKNANEQLIKSAYSIKDHLDSFPDYRRFEINGLSVCLKSGHGTNLSSPVTQYIQRLLKLNMEGPYGSEWQEEEKVKRREMVDPEARYIFVHEVANANADEMTTVLTEEDPSTSRQEDSGPLVGFVHYRFVLEEEVPVLYVYELQLEPRVQGKGLGKLLMELIELIAQKNCMGAVVLTVQRANISAMNFYTSKLRYIISATSPSKVDPMMEKSYEILCRIFNDEAKTIFEDTASGVDTFPADPNQSTEHEAEIPDMTSGIDTFPADPIQPTEDEAEILDMASGIDTFPAEPIQPTEDEAEIPDTASGVDTFPGDPDEPTDDEAEIPSDDDVDADADAERIETTDMRKLANRMYFGIPE